MANIRQALYAWREEQAAAHAVELFRILPNTTIEEIVRVMPKTKEELVAIKGIKEAKYQAYGQAILRLVHTFSSPAARATVDPSESRHISSFEPSGPALRPISEDAPYSVSGYLDVVNRALWRINVRIEGEVTSMKIQGSAIYLTMKDIQDASVLSVFMWLSDYELCGVEVREGLQVVVSGKSEVYKPSGRMNFRAQQISLVGEGALKAAYEQLKKKLTLEGLFTEERKRPIPELPVRIGVITSRSGAVIHDFLNNLGKHAFAVSLIDARVEGIQAVRDILGAIRRFEQEEIDVLVVIRGGGSLESLQAFNNELVVRAIARFPHPVICAIGHDQDVPLAQLVADAAPSTPTACTALLNASWETAIHDLAFSERVIMTGYAGMLSAHRHLLTGFRTTLSDELNLLRERFLGAQSDVLQHVPALSRALMQAKRSMQEAHVLSLRAVHGALEELSVALQRAASDIAAHDPIRNLKLGYSILRSKGAVVRSLQDAPIGSDFEARLSDGTLKATVTGHTQGTE